MTKKIYITRPLPDAVIAAAQKLGEVDVRRSTDPMTPEETRAALESYDAVLASIGDPLGAEAFTGALRCKMLANFGVGYNHIDAAAARAAGIAVTNTPGAVTDATADIAVMLILMAARGASHAERVLRAGQWDGWHPTQLLGTHVTGKTLGIIGMGAIGKATARRCHYGFGMDVVFYNRSKLAYSDVPGAKQLPTIKDVMQTADFVSLHVPGGPATHHLIDADTLAAMRPEAFLINTARGNIVDEAALTEALRQGRIAGAGLDVFENEPDITPGLLELDNVTLLPHLGTAALSVRTDMGLMAVDNLRAWINADPLPNPVN
jgi:lactate dehydrogenase-like 2-hydroxyacid dehydrogenase